MPTRIQQFTNILGDVLNPKTNRPVSISLKTPNNVPAQNLESVTIFPGDYSKRTVNTDNTGAYTLSADYPGDLTPAGCSYIINEDGHPVEAKGFAYSASPINVATLYPVPTVVGNQLLMRFLLSYTDSSPIQGGYIDVDISDKAVTTDGRSLLPNNPKRFFTDINGVITLLQDVTSTLTPSTVLQKIIYANGSYDLYSVPANPTGWQGAWSATTHYHMNSDTLASPSDVVSQGGLLYQCVVPDSLNHMPPHADFEAFPGERIEWHVSGGSGIGLRSLTAANVVATPLVITEADDHAAAPTTLEQQLQNLHYRTRKNVRRVTAATTIVADDDVLEVDGTTAAYNVTMPLCANRNKPITVKLVVSAAFAVTLVANTDAVLFDGAATFALSTLYQTVRLVPNYNNTAWNVV